MICKKGDNIPNGPHFIVTGLYSEYEMVNIYTDIIIEDVIEYEEVVEIANDYFSKNRLLGSTFVEIYSIVDHNGNKLL